ncbi:TetR/AcrR family transcriptional regulator [Jiella mangrovi]|uniref:TetR/AcrR family transcriptional regulator n=1 Tax=Jiella mangrovi TaxID=2821407 RepID=A0ABS4BCE8_9HYPH|nr:TetR/AcrR family transcriptional regulator [Jiella mangrovi]MBP0614415.1 TetR/AcrR family transcriptional regulator [Jiella mangrovi]
MSDDKAITELPPPLLESALAEFRQHGFADANVGRIASAAGMSKKTIYRHVPSKEALLEAVMHAMVTRSVGPVTTAAPGLSPAEWLKTFMKAFAALTFSEHGIASYRVVMSEAQRFPHVSQLYVQTVKRLAIRPLADQLAAYGRDGRIDIKQAERAAMMLVSMIVADGLRDAVLGLAEPPRGAELDALVNEGVDIFLQGIARDRPLGDLPSRG